MPSQQFFGFCQIGCHHVVNAFWFEEGSSDSHLPYGCSGWWTFWGLTHSRIINQPTWSHFKFFETCVYPAPVKTEGETSPHPFSSNLCQSMLGSDCHPAHSCVPRRWQRTRVRIIFSRNCNFHGTCFWRWLGHQSLAKEQAFFTQVEGHSTLKQFWGWTAHLLTGLDLAHLLTGTDQCWVLNAVWMLTCVF